MAKGKISIPLEIPTTASPDAENIEIISYIRELVSRLTTKSDSRTGQPYIDLSAQGLIDILSALDNDVQFDADTAFREVLKPKKPLNSDAKLKPIFSGALNRDAMARLMRAKLDSSGLSQRVFCEEYQISLRDFRRVLEKSATLDKSIELLTQVGISTQFSAYEIE